MLSFCGCADDESQNCGVSDPVTELQWLKQEIDDATASHMPSITYDLFIYQGNYRGRTVFINQICCPTCNTSAPTVRSCTGELVGSIGVDIDYSIIEKATVLWRTHNGVCP